MNDPAVLAARRAFDKLWPDQGDFEFNFDSSTREYAVDAAREALKPLQKLHQELVGNMPQQPQVAVGMRRVLDAFAPLIYGGELSDTPRFENLEQRIPRHRAEANGESLWPSSMLPHSAKEL